MSRLAVEQFRTEQVLWGAAATAIGVAIAVLSVLLGQANPLILVLLIVGFAISGVLARDWWLAQAVAKRDADMLVEFPVVAEMLALAVTAGEGPVGAIDRITRLAKGYLVDQLAGLLADTRSGTPLLEAITTLRDRTRLEPLARFLDGMAVAIERGTPLADVLRAQAADVRAMSKRQLLEAGGRKEIAMMVPVNNWPPSPCRSWQEATHVRAWKVPQSEPIAGLRFWDSYGTLMSCGSRWRGRDRDPGSGSLSYPSSAASRG